MNSTKGDEPMRIIVTGANGFVGTHLVRQLLPDHHVLAIDNLRYGPWRFDERERNEFDAVQLDLREKQKVASLVRAFEPTAVIHLAAVHFIPECERAPDEAVSINIQATVNLITACPSVCRFVFASTAAVYAPDTAAHIEDESTIGPVDVYGHTKLCAENLTRYFARQKGIQSVIVRLFNVVGPGETNPHVVPTILSQLREGKRQLSLGNVTPKRDYIFVSDAAQGFIAAALRDWPLEHPDVVICNLGTGRSHSVIDLVGLLEGIIGERISIQTDRTRLREVDRPHLLADTNRMQKLFSWSSTVGIDDALMKTWEATEWDRIAVI